MFWEQLTNSFLRTPRKITSATSYFDLEEYLRKIMNRKTKLKHKKIDPLLFTQAQRHFKHELRKRLWNSKVKVVKTDQRVFENLIPQVP